MDRKVPGWAAFLIIFGVALCLFGVIASFNPGDIFK